MANPVNWLIAFTGIFFMILAVLGHFSNDTGKNSANSLNIQLRFSSISGWVKDADTTGKKIIRKLFLLVTVILLLLIAITGFLILKEAYDSHSGSWTGIFNIVVVAVAAVEAILLFLYRKNRGGFFLYMFAWILLLSYVVIAAVSTMYFDGKSGLDSNQAVISGAVCLLIAMISFTNLTLYIHDIWKNKGVESLRWFRRTEIYIIVSILFSVSVVVLPLWHKNEILSTAFEIVFSIATWEYLKDLWDERINPLENGE